MKALAIVPLAALLALVLVARPVGAGQLGTEIPSHCTAHTSFNGRRDVPGDYRCAGLAIEYHTAGVAFSPVPIWAGQWLFTDPDGQFRVGYCTLNRGNHPTIAVPSRPVAQALPNDPGGRRTAYLTWRHGDTTDALTAAALWAVLHYYAQDAAGTNRSSNGTSPLVPRLDRLQAGSGRADLQARAIELDAEAARFAGEWQLTVSLAADGTVTATLLAGTTPVPDQPITVLVSGSDLPHAAITSTEGTATVAVPLPSGTVTVVATATAPGPGDVFRGVPAAPDPQGAQLLVTAGDPVMLRAATALDIPEPTTTTTEPTTTTTTEPPPTTTTTEPTTTTTEPTTTTTTTEPLATTTTEPPPTTTEPPPPTSPPTSAAATVPPSLPRTGGGTGDSPVAYLGTALLVGGMGLLGTLRRPVRQPYT